MTPDAKPISNEPVARSTRDDSRVHKNAPKDDKFTEEMNTAKGVAKLKKHSKSLDSETDEEVGKLPTEEKEGSTSLFGLTHNEKKKPPPNPEIARKQTDGSRSFHEQPMPAQNVSIFSAAAQSGAEAPAASKQIQEVIKQVVDHITELQHAGKTHTIATLSKPPLFKGANLVLTSYDSAHGEINIAFEKLSLKAKAFLDANHLTDSLKTALEQKGITTHMITTTTLEETKLPHGAMASNARNPKQGDDDQSGGKRQRDQDQGDEESLS